MPYINIATIHNPAEWMIQQIKQNCNNPDDLSKIFIAVESMLDDIQPVPQSAPTLEQLKQMIKTE